jgi:predicted ATP-dependent serine protease
MVYMCPECGYEDEAGGRCPQCNLPLELFRNEGDEVEEGEADKDEEEGEEEPS